MRDRLVERLERAKYPVADLEVVELGDDLLEIVATLVSTAIVPGDLDAVVGDLQRQPGVRPRHLASQHQGLIEAFQAAVAASRSSTTLPRQSAREQIGDVLLTAAADFTVSLVSPCCPIIALRASAQL
jgi:hypothetical protein